MENFLSPVFLHHPATSPRRSGFLHVHDAEGLPWGAWGQAWAVALCGGAAGAVLLRALLPRLGPPSRCRPWRGSSGDAARNKFYVDEIYDFFIIRPFKFLSFVFYKVVDTLLIDTVAVRGTAWVTAQVGAVLRYAQTGDVQSYAAVMALAAGRRHRLRAVPGAPMSSLFDTHLTSLVIFVPALFALLVLLFPKEEKGPSGSPPWSAWRWAFALARGSTCASTRTGPEFQFEYRAHWIAELGISYHVGRRRPLGLADAADRHPGADRGAGLLGLHHRPGQGVPRRAAGAADRDARRPASLDLVLFYVFWEAMLVPMYLLIGVWGSEERQIAAVKFFLYTFAGSVLMLVAILSLYFIAQPAGARSFDYAAIYNALLPATRELAACLKAPTAAGR